MKCFVLFIFCIGLTTNLNAQNKDETFFRYDEIFTPNGDGKNDTWQFAWKLNVNNFVVKVYNRYGVEVFTSTDKKFIWNGKSKKGKAVADATYYFICTFNYLGKEENVKGNLTIIQ